MFASIFFCLLGKQFLLLQDQKIFETRNFTIIYDNLVHVHMLTQYELNDLLYLKSSKMISGSIQTTNILGKNVSSNKDTIFTSFYADLALYLQLLSYVQKKY